MSTKEERLAKAHKIVACEERIRRVETAMHWASDAIDVSIIMGRNVAHDVYQALNTDEDKLSSELRDLIWARLREARSQVENELEELLSK